MASTTPGRSRRAPIAMRRLASAWRARSAGSAGAGSSTPSYVTPYLSMNSWRTAQKAGAFIAWGVPWLGASTLP